MITIPIQVSGDTWNNRSDVEQQLAALPPNIQIILDLCSEGPSLHYIGVIELLSKYNFDVSITRWSNGVETVPFSRQFCNKQSHFYPMAIHYWGNEITNDPCTEFKFGLFLGRNTPERNRILYDTVHQWSGQFLLSKLSNNFQRDINNDFLEQWVNSCAVPSLQGYSIQDQYQVPEISTGKMMSSLIKDHYSKFNIELVCETYTLGDAFFPTEKTVRPIVGNKPFIVYGPKDFLNNLRSTEKFQTFGELWDESYDLLEGLPRWNAITQLIDKLSSMSESQWADTIRRASAITQHNRTILKNIIDARKKL